MKQNLGELEWWWVISVRLVFFLSLWFSTLLLCILWNSQAVKLCPNVHLIYTGSIFGSTCWEVRGRIVYQIKCSRHFFVFKWITKMNVLISTVFSVANYISTLLYLSSSQKNIVCILWCVILWKVARSHINLLDSVWKDSIWIHMWRLYSQLSHYQLAAC